MESLSLKCGCGYIKHDVMHLGEWKDYHQRLLKYCGGIFYVEKERDGVRCKKCGTRASSIELHCSICDRVTVLPVKYRSASRSGNTTTIQMSVHKTIVFSIQ